MSVDLHLDAIYNRLTVVERHAAGPANTGSRYRDSGGPMNAIVYALPMVTVQHDAAVIALPRRTPYGLQEALPLEWPATPAVAQRHLALVAPRCSQGPNGSFDAQPTRRSDLPPAGPWAGRLVHGIVEVVNGVRPAAQLTRWLDPAVLNQVRTRVVGRSAPALRVRSVHVAETDDGVAESCAVISSQARTTALALRLEGLDGRWRATALEWLS